MDAIKKIFFTHEDKLKYIVFASTGIAGFNCLTRPDYNFFLFIYFYYIWFFCSLNKDTINREKAYCFYFLGFSFFVDAVWIYYWSGNSHHLKNIERGAHILVIFLSFIGMIAKSIVVISIGLNEWDAIKGSLPGKLLEKLNVPEDV